jgi:hypothetical protein
MANTAASNPTTVLSISQTRTSAKPGEYQTVLCDGNLTLTADYPEILKIDPGGSARDVTLETPVCAMRRRIINAADAAENLVVKDVSPATVATINQNEEAEFWYPGTGSAWSLICVKTIALS